MNTLSIVLVAALAVSAAGRSRNMPEVMREGSCPLVEEAALWARQTPKRSQIGGTWYQYANSVNEFQPIQKCLRIDFDFDGENFQTSATGFDEDESLMKTQGRIYPSPDGQPRLMISQEYSSPAPLVVLDTDYSNYMCLYSCMEFGGVYTDYSFIFSRTPKLDDTYVKACEDAFSAIGVEPSHFNKTPQGDQCPYEEQESL